MDDLWKYHETDKLMSKRLEAVFGDPKRHKFYSWYDYDEAIDRRGPRGGKIRGLKRVCSHCGNKKKGHAEKTEEIS